jgi:hypothetical protein
MARRRRGRYTGQLQAQAWGWGTDWGLAGCRLQGEAMGQCGMLPCPVYAVWGRHVPNHQSPCMVCLGEVKVTELDRL